MLEEVSIIQNGWRWQQCILICLIIALITIPKLCSLDALDRVFCRWGEAKDGRASETRSRAPIPFPQDRGCAASRAAIGWGGQRKSWHRANRDLPKARSTFSPQAQTPFVPKPCTHSPQIANLRALCKLGPIFANFISQALLPQAESEFSFLCTGRNICRRFTNRGDRAN